MNLLEKIAYMEEHLFDVRWNDDGVLEVYDKVSGISEQGVSFVTTLNAAIKRHKHGEDRLTQEQKDKSRQYRRLRRKLREERDQMEYSRLKRKYGEHV